MQSKLKTLVTSASGIVTRGYIRKMYLQQVISAFYSWLIKNVQEYNISNLRWYLLHAISPLGLNQVVTLNIELIVYCYHPVNYIAFSMAQKVEVSLMIILVTTLSSMVTLVEVKRHWHPMGQRPFSIRTIQCKIPS